jgi:hypothetical protein
MVVVNNYGTGADSVRISQNRITAVGRLSIAIIVATLMVMMVSTSYLVFSKGQNNHVELDGFDPVSR